MKRLEIIKPRRHCAGSDRQPAKVQILTRSYGSQMAAVEGLIGLAYRLCDRGVSQKSREMEVRSIAQFQRDSMPGFSAIADVLIIGPLEMIADGLGAAVQEHLHNAVPLDIALERAGVPRDPSAALGPKYLTLWQLTSRESTGGHHVTL